MPVISGGNVMSGDGMPRGAFTKAGVVVANDFAGQCRVGSMAINTSAGTIYMCTATNGTTTSTWALVTQA